MKVIIFGATGRVGNQLVLQALVKKYLVTAFLRKEADLPFTSENLVKVEGNVLDEEVVTNAVAGHDVVLVSLGDFKPDEEITIMSEGAKNILWAMKQKGIKRIIGVGNAGILQHDEIALRKNQEYFPSYLQYVAEDHLRMFMRFQKSELDWTIVCPNNIPDGGATGVYRIRKNYPPRHGIGIRTGDVAHFMLREMEERKFIKTRVGIAY
jgi:putative NADH-flavin reductase